MKNMCPLEKSIEIARLLQEESIWLAVIKRPDVDKKTKIRLAKESKSDFILKTVLDGM
jgi:hypothetical protein